MLCYIKENRKKRSKEIAIRLHDDGCCVSKTIFKPKQQTNSMTTMNYIKKIIEKTAEIQSNLPKATKLSILRFEDFKNSNEIENNKILLCGFYLKI